MLDTKRVMDFFSDDCDKKLYNHVTDTSLLDENPVYKDWECDIHDKLVGMCIQIYSLLPCRDERSKLTE